MDPLSFIMSLIGVGSNLAGTAYGTNTGRAEAALEREFNAQQAALNRDFQTSEREAAQQFNFDMWNLNNQYNSPAEQLKRAREAGISPLALFGSNYNQAVSQPISTNPSLGNAASASGAGAFAASLLSQYGNIGSAMSDIYESMSRADATNYDTFFQRKTEEDRIKHLKASINLTDANVQEVLSQAGLNDVNKATFENALEWAGKFNPVQLQKMTEEVNLFRTRNYETLVNAGYIVQKTYESQASEDSIRKSLEESDSRISLNSALTNQAVSQTFLNGASLADVKASASLKAANAEFVGSQKAGQDLENAILEIKKEFSAQYKIPLDSPEFMFYFHLMSSGLFGQWVDKVVLPHERAKWKPSDYEHLGLDMQAIFELLVKMAGAYGAKGLGKLF